MVKSAVAPISYYWDFAHSALYTERRWYGYAPIFNPGRVSFASNGRPMIRDQGFNLQALQDDGTWESINLLDIARLSLAAQNISWVPASVGQYVNGATAYADPDVNGEARVVFDKDCNGYALLIAGRSSLGYSLLLHSYDGGHSWAAYKIPGSEGQQTNVRMEVPSHPAALDQTPALLLNVYSPDTPAAGWPLRLVLPVKNADKTITFAGPYKVASNTISSNGVGGAENYAVSYGDMVHIVYPGDQLFRDGLNGRIGVPQYAISFSRSQGRVTAGPTFLGDGDNYASLTALDPHNQPVIAVDGNGYLHVVLSGHGGPLYYKKSSAPSETSSWGAPETIAPNLSSYASLIVDQYDEPVVVWRDTSDSNIYKLSWTMKNVNTGQWTSPQVLLDPGRSEYAHYYQKLSIDPWGRIFINYLYFPDDLFSDEAAVVQYTFGNTLTPLNNICGAVTTRAAPNHCYSNYSGYGYLSNAVMMSKGLGRNCSPPPPRDQA